VSSVYAMRGVMALVWVNVCKARISYFYFMFSPSFNMDLLLRFFYKGVDFFEVFVFGEYIVMCLGFYKFGFFRH